MVPCGCPGDPWGLLGTFWEPVRDRFQAKLTINERNWRFWDVPGTSRAASGDPGIPKSSLKIELLLKKVGPTVIFLSIFVRKYSFHDFLRFFIDFPPENTEKSVKKAMYIFTAAVVFFNMATLTKHRILRYESFFFIFCVFAFFGKKALKKVI